MFKKNRIFNSQRHIIVTITRLKIGTIKFKQ